MDSSSSNIWTWVKGEIGPGGLAHFRERVESTIRNHSVLWTGFCYFREKLTTGEVITHIHTRPFSRLTWVSRCPLILLTVGFGAKFYGYDDRLDASQQKHVGLHLFCIHQDSLKERGITVFCIDSPTLVFLLNWSLLPGWWTQHLTNTLVKENILHRQNCDRTFPH